MNGIKGILALLIFILLFTGAWMLNQRIISETKKPSQIRIWDVPDSPFLPRQYIRSVPAASQ